MIDPVILIELTRPSPAIHINADIEVVQMINDINMKQFVIENPADIMDDEPEDPEEIPENWA